MGGRSPFDAGGCGEPYTLRPMHVLARLQGFGAIVLPKAPYRIARVPDAPETRLRIAHGERSEVVDVTEAGAIEVADITRGDGAERWRIETTVMTCAWPAGFDLASDPEERSPFLLLGPGDAMVWLSGPVDREQTQPIESLAVDGQTIRAVAQSGERERIDVDYTIGGERWWQRRYVVPWTKTDDIVVTGQARPETEELTALAVDLVERSLEPTRTE
jgi:hypothetical protein